MLEKAKAVTSESRFTYIEYARFADDLVILVDGYRRWNWLLERAYRRLLEELARLDVKVNREKTQVVDLTKGKSFSFLGFDIRRVYNTDWEMGSAYYPEDEGTDKSPEEF